MTLLDMQRVLSRILTDKTFQQSFIEGDEPDSATYQLTERELRSLRGLRWDRVGLHTDLLAHGRLELALKGLPLTALLLHEQLHGQLDRFCAEYPPVPQPAGHLYLEATRLCDFAVRLFGEGVLRPTWAVDVVSYERTMLTLAISAEVAASAATVAELNEEWSWQVLDWPPEDLGDFIPVGGPHVTVVSFSFPLPDLLPMLDDGAVPASVPQLEQPLLLLFGKVSRGPVQMIKVNAAAAALAEACDGERTIAGVVDQLSRRFGPGVEAQAVGALGWLRENGVIGLRKGT
jgi:hypothetical protein